MQNLIGLSFESPADDYFFKGIQSDVPLSVAIEILEGPFERFVL